MEKLRERVRIPDRLTSRRGAWISLGAALVAFVVLFGLFGGAEGSAGSESAPGGSESTRVARLLEEFPDAGEQSVLIVAERRDSAPLSDADVEALTASKPALDRFTGSASSGPMVSDDGGAAVVVVPISVGSDNTETAEVVGGLRGVVAEIQPSGLDLQVTGGPAFGADIASAFDGADVTLLIVTIAIVAVLLIATYRSPVLWLIPLIVVGLADQVAGQATAALGAALDLQFDAGIISVLVFGAGTNYALLLVSRYREELLETADHRPALAEAWRRTVPAIVASNATVILALLTLVLAVVPGTRGLALSSALGLLIALVAVLFALPPFLAVCGRKVFWPFVPRPGSAVEQGRVWQAVASRVMRRPVLGLTAGLALLAVMAAGLVGTTVGLDQQEKFRVQSESASGLEVLAEHFDAGEAQPILIVSDRERAGEVVEAVEAVDGVVRANAVAESADGALSRIMVTGEYAPGTDAGLQLVETLREVAHSVHGADALVGGAGATDLDARAGNERDLKLIAPLVLGVSFAVLAVLLRSLVAPVVLLLVNTASAVAAIGAGAWLSRVVFGQEALDLQVPLLSFLFLVALGIDYTIFLVHRARSEALVRGTRDGMVRAVARTGGVITSAGIVLAAVFAALGVLPLVTLGQLGLIVGLGVVVDTLVVRTVIVPAVFGVLGDRIWWPRQIGPESGESSHEHRELALAGR
ncbi:MMPL family transporter [Zhihengliuella salsuginis]|uniref:Membrane protein n=1 Tax=Zhihengliuella salsuginis TaxID=578222 RepID=A0ABQ3GJS2_9MICC|nr:MMPL family transporter [Zhihengliuella salsuginis]GHD11204.1 membrane protein [Zhihengliuella salsuginis]